MPRSLSATYAARVKMEFSVLCDGLKKNGFDVKPLTAAKRSGCVGDYVDLFTTLFNTLEEALVHGVNTRFVKGMKGNIEDIIDLVSDISEEKNGLKLKKYTGKVEKVVEKTEKVMKKGDILIMKSELLERIDTYIEGTQAYLEDETRPERRDVLAAGLEKLKEIKAAVENVSVFTGKEAQEHATSVVASLKVWSNDVADAMQDDQSLKSLDAALEKTKDWSGIRSTRKNDVDMTAITFDENDMEDGLTAAVKVRRFDVKANHFRENLATYTETIERRYSTEKDEARLAKEEETRDNLKARIKEVRAAYKNGEISEDDALDELEDITADLDDAEGEIADLKDYIRETKTAGSAFRRHLKTLERLMEVIDKYGEFDCTYMPAEEDGLYRSKCGYTVKKPRRGFLGTSSEVLLLISFDENGIAVDCEEGYRPGG